LSSRRVFNEGGGWVLEHKPEMRQEKRGEGGARSG
jgi:hypothetical protein